MKKTTIEFDLRVSGGNDDDCLSGLTSVLSALSGVAQITCERDAPFATLRVTVTFPDKSAAKRLHRKVMNTIKKTPRISITRITSNLTEIFD
jgi:hypothetical protein